MKHQKKIGLATAVVFTIILTIAQWFYAGHSTASGRLIVWFFDVGQGDAIFIETPSGHQVLIDGGPGDAVLDKLSAVLPFWDRTIDDIILTHPHADHLDGLVEVVERYAVDQVYLTHVDYFTPAGPEFAGRVSDVEEVIEVVGPTTINLGDGVQLQIVYPSSSLAHKKVNDVNDSSIVALLTYGETSILLTGDITEEEEMAVAEAIDGFVDVLKVAHHGSAYSSTTAFLNDLHPAVAIISAGEGNSYGHPAPSTLRRLQAIGARIFRTDLVGDVRLISDGGEPTVEPLPL